jgi:hypothetical protein
MSGILLIHLQAHPIRLTRRLPILLLLKKLHNLRSPFAVPSLCVLHRLTIRHHQWIRQDIGSHLRLVIIHRNPRNLSRWRLHALVRRSIRSRSRLLGDNREGKHESKNRQHKGATQEPDQHPILRQSRFHRIPKTGTISTEKHPGRLTLHCQERSFSDPEKSGSKARGSIPQSEAQ